MHMLAVIKLTLLLKEIISKERERETETETVKTFTNWLRDMMTSSSYSFRYSLTHSLTHSLTIYYHTHAIMHMHILQLFLS